MICMVFIICLAGCKKSPEPTAVTTGLSFTAEINYNDSEIICDIVLDNSEKGMYTVVSPKQVKDFSYVFDGEEVQVNYKGLTYHMNQTPYINLFYIINSAFETLRKNENSPILNDKLYIFSGETEYGKFKFTTTKNGLPINAEFEDMNVLFKNISIH